jgi:hypothetical protein
MEVPSVSSAASLEVEAGAPSQSIPSDLADPEPNGRGLVMGVVGSTVGFALLYVALMVPTYILPYSGSNSAFVGVLGVAIGKGLMPQTWAHLWSLALVIVIAWMRGATIGKGFLPAISFCAALFDMTPVLNVIPLVPTVLHVVTLAIGVSGKSENGDGAVLRATGRRAVMAAAAMTLVAVGGSILFMTTAKQGMRELGNGIAKPADPLRGYKGAEPKLAPRVPEQQALTAPPKAPTPAPAVAPAPTPASVAVAPKPTPEPVLSAPVVAAQPKPAPVPVVAKPASSPASKPSTASVPNPNKATIAAMLSDASTCMASKRYECAITNAKSVLRLDPGNADAAQLQQRATAAQNQALQSISIN